MENRIKFTAAFLVIISICSAYCFAVEVSHEYGPIEWSFQGKPVPETHWSPWLPPVQTGFRFKLGFLLSDGTISIKTPIKLVIIGPPSNLYQDYYSKVSRLVEESNRSTKHKVVFLGMQSKQELIRWYQTATVFVCPSISEPFGIVNLEALSCGTPVVASRVGGIPEAVEDQKNGLLVNSNAPEELAEAIQLLLTNPEMRADFGREGRKSVLQRFSSNAVAHHLARIYVSMISNS